MRNAALLAGLLLAYGSGLAQSAPVILQAVRADRAPVIDGRLDDACWSATPAATDFLINNTDTPAKYTTRAMVAFDDSALYIGVRCSEPNPADIETEPLIRDHDNVFRTDCVEVMLDPGQTRNDYFHIGINASDSISDRACTQGGFIGDSSWDSTAEGASTIGADFWSCELCVPYNCLNITPAVGDTWRINICREKKRPVENSSLAEQGAFNIANRFAELRGVSADLSRYCYDIGVPGLEKTLKDGKLELMLNVPLRNSTGEAGRRLLDGWLVSPSGKVVSASSSADPAPGEQLGLPLGPMVLDEQGEYACTVRIADPVTKAPLAFRKTMLDIHYVPVAIRLWQPWYRNAIFATQKLTEVVLDAQVDLDDTARQGCVLDVSITPEGSAEAAAQATVRNPSRSNPLRFEAGRLPEGKLEISARLTGPGGEQIADTTHPLRKLPYVKGEVWLGQDLQWRVDGEPLFMNGAWNYPEDFVPEYNVFTHPKPGESLFLDCQMMNDLHYRAPSMKLDRLSAEDAQMIRDYVREAKRRPEMFGYYISDEPEVSGTQARVLEEVYRVFAEEDPYHPVVISNDSMHGLRVYARCADINGLHPYPVILKDKPVNDLGAVATFTEEAVRFFEPLAHKQTVAYLHQGFNYGDYGAVNNRIPSYVEYRSQNLLALICGSRGTLQFNRMVAHYPELRLGMPHLTRELAALEPVFLALTAETAVATDSDKLRVLAKGHAGQLWLLACNADMAPREARITFPGLGARAQKLTVVSEGRLVNMVAGAITDHFEPYEVHIYTTGPAPKLPTVASIVAEIAAANDARRKPGNLAFQIFEGDGVVVTASSSKSGKFQRPDNGLWHVVDGVVDSVDHYACLTWQDDTPDQGPDWVAVKLPAAQPIGRVVVHAFEKSLRDYSVQAMLEGDWREVASASGQGGDMTAHEFPPVVSDQVRILVSATNGPNAKVAEVEVYAR